MLSRRLSLIALIAALCVATPAPSPAASAGAAAGGTPGRATHYAMTASANIGHVQQYRTPPVPENGAVGARVVCTNRIGHRDAASADGVDLRGVSIDDASSVAWTSRTGRKTVASSRSTIATAEINEPSIGTVTLTGIGSLTQVWHGRHGFHKAVHATLGSIVLHPLSGDDVTYPVPQPGHSVTIEDTVRVGIGLPKASESDHGTWAELNAVTVRLLNETSTKFYLAYSQARIQGGVGKQLYGGIALPDQSHDASGPLQSARDDVWTVPCVGSGGRRSGFGVIGRTLSDTVSASWVSGYQRSGLDRGGRPSVIVTTGIRKVTIDGGLEIRGIHGRASSIWSQRHGYLLSGRGTTVHRVLLNGDPVQLRGRHPVTVGDIAILKPRIVTRSKGSIEVTPLRVIMLDGSGQVFDLGFARATLRPSGL